jgi:hypothetical protein
MLVWAPNGGIVPRNFLFISCTTPALLVHSASVIADLIIGHFLSNSFVGRSGSSPLTYCLMKVSVVLLPLAVNLGILHIVQITLQARAFTLVVMSDATHASLFLTASSWSSAIDCLIESSWLCSIGVTLFWPPGWRISCIVDGECLNPVLAELALELWDDSALVFTTDSSSSSSSLSCLSGSGFFLFCVGLQFVAVTLLPFPAFLLLLLLAVVLLLATGGILGSNCWSVWRKSNGQGVRGMASRDSCMGWEVLTTTDWGTTARHRINNNCEGLSGANLMLPPR